MKVSASKLAPGYSREQLFAIASDIESYPSFLPLCQATRILEQQGDQMTVDNVFRLGPARIRFTSFATFFHPERIEIVSTEDPFERLEITWLIELIDETECRVTFEADTRFRSPLVGKLAELFGPNTEQRTLDAFFSEAGRRFSRQE